ncbi:MAG TPA: EscU/YscU/HrcU family type III secretion system export apparatus switch protein [Bryobacteraceae bacterium]|nr:EscU/YscU/HrcU family type III secretion system export apparatus switch protein [Bryobacteraceae bacterium]
MSDKGQRTEQPTQRRLQKAREQGQFLSAKDLVGAIQFGVFTITLAWAGPAWFTTLQVQFTALLRDAFRQDFGPAVLTACISSSLAVVFMPLAKAGALLAAISLGVQLTLSSVGFSFKALAPNFGRLNPIKKLGEIGKQALTLAIHTTLLVVVLSSISWSLISDNFAMVVSLPLTTLQSGTAWIGAAVLSLLWKCCLVLLVFGAIDLIRQKRKLDGQLRMTKQEVREESKENEGNPQIKSQIRRLRRELLRGRMMNEVARATAVLVNPTHYSVAIRYDPETMASPVVVAKGKNYLAKLIRERAISHQVPIVENPPLARALYASADVGQQIPVEFYKAVAEILAYLYRMMNRRP